MLPEERQNSKILIAQYSTGRFGVSENYLSSADAIEIKIGQCAKPNQGGLLPADKVTEEIALLRNVPMGKDVHSPPAHPDIFSINDLKKKVNWLKKSTDGKPVIIKLAATDVENDVKLAMKAKPDVIAIDGLGGGTGAAPSIMLDNFGIPTLSALVKARKAMGNSKQELIIAGGLNSGADIAKALALGADAVYLATSCLVAMGCIYCKQCFKSRCPFGITTQDPELRKKLDVEAASKNVAHFLMACNEEVKMVAAAFGRRNVHGIKRDGLRSLNLLTKEITGVPLI
jgi:glutamate synthase domain-containing protein 2